MKRTLDFPELTDAITRLARKEPVYGALIEGDRFDAGNPMDFLMVNAELGAGHPRLGGESSNILRQLLQDN